MGDWPCARALCRSAPTMLAPCVVTFCPDPPSFLSLVARLPLTLFLPTWHPSRAVGLPGLGSDDCLTGMPCQQ